MCNGKGGNNRGWPLYLLLYRLSRMSRAAFGMAMMSAKIIDALTVVLWEI